MTDVRFWALESEMAKQIRELLAIENATTLAQVSTWADEIGPQRRETAPWYFVDIPIHLPPGTPAAYDAVRHCPRGRLHRGGNRTVLGGIARRASGWSRSNSSCIS